MKILIWNDSMANQQTISNKKKLRKSQTLFCGQSIWGGFHFKRKSRRCIKQLAVPLWMNKSPYNVKGSKSNCACQPSEWTALFACPYLFRTFFFYFLLHDFEKEKKGETRIVDPSTNQKGEKKKKKKKWLTAELGGEMNDATPAMKGPAAPNDNDLWPNRRDISINELQNASISHGLLDCCECAGRMKYWNWDVSFKFRIHSTKRNQMRKSTNPNVRKCKFVTDPTWWKLSIRRGGH